MQLTGHRESWIVERVRGREGVFEPEERRGNMKVLEIWRYPVKSMLGEQLDQVEVGPNGVEGDRRRAVVDAESGVSLSAKRYLDLLRCRAWTNGDEVMIGLPDGSELVADSAQAADGLSDLLGRRVTVRNAGAGHEVRHEFPTDLAVGEGETFIWEPGLDAYFDRAPLHLITTATLNEFTRLRPASAFTRDRFRPNFLVKIDGAGFVEDAWVGKELTIGSVKCLVLDRKPRCVMTTRAQGELSKDTEIVKAIVKGNDGNAGIELAAREPGIVRCGDRVILAS
jgi:hypothetical protein